MSRTRACGGCCPYGYREKAGADEKNVASDKDFDANKPATERLVERVRKSLEEDILIV